MFIQEFYSNIHAIDTSVPQFTIVFREIRIVVTLELISAPKLISEVLHVPRVARLNYPSHPCLCSIFRDELATCFHETAKVWGGLQNVTTHDFAKGPRILNMMMTFVLTPRSHYNTITEPHAHFLISLLEGLSIDFPSYMIVSIIDIYQDTATYDKLIFPSAITCISHTCTFLFLLPLSSLAWVLLVKSLYGGVIHSWLLSGLMWSLLQLNRRMLTFVLRRMLPMPLDPLLICSIFFFWSRGIFCYHLGSTSAHVCSYWQSS